MASPSPSHILLFGATGNIGRYIVEGILAAQPAFPKVTVFTNASTVASKPELIAGWRAAGVSIVTGDVGSADDVRAALGSGVDTVVSALGRDALQLQMQLLRLAEESPGVRWFFPSEYGTDTEHNERSAVEKPHQVKRAVHRFVRDEIHRLKVTYLVTGPYFDMWANTPFITATMGGFDVPARKAVILADGEQKISFTTRKDVGTALVAALQHPEAAAGQYLRVASFIATPNQVLAEFEAQVGAKFDVKFMPLPELEALEEKMWAEDHPARVGASLRRIAAEGGSEYPGGLDNDAIALGEYKLESLSEAVRQQIAETS